MPGIFGGAGCGREVYERLREEFCDIWQNCEFDYVGAGMLGGHAFADASALHRTPDGLHFVVDGEASVYRLAEGAAAGKGLPLFEVRSTDFHLTAACKGNVVATDPRTGVWFLATEWAGSFPLYYAHNQAGGLLFCSHLRPLARVVMASPDWLGIVQWLREGYTLGGRTFYENIRGLMPGQVLGYDPVQKRIELRETSEAWGVLEKGFLARPDYAAEACWETLTKALRCCLMPDQQHAVMISGGWDSRTLLAAARSQLGGDQLLGYTHGDLRSREIRLAAKLCGSMGIDVHQRPLDEALCDVEFLTRAFRRVEHAVFPHWHRAGELLAQAGVQCVSAGPYGPVLGGHSGPANMLSGWRKPAAVVTSMFARSIAHQGNSERNLEGVYDLFRIQQLKKPWYLSQKIWAAIPGVEDAINADIETDLKRLERRGVKTAEQLVEAFITEHRSAQYITAQLLSCRLAVDIALPFADRELLTLASSIPLHTKVHNSLNRHMLWNHAPELLRFPHAAMLVSARAPLLMQECSRLVRRVYEGLHWNLHFATNGFVDFPRLSWANFEFLRNGQALKNLARDLHNDCWDRKATWNLIARVQSMEWKKPLHPVYDQFLKIYTVELMLR